MFCAPFAIDYTICFEKPSHQYPIKYRNNMHIDAEIEILSILSSSKFLGAGLAMIFALRNTPSLRDK